MSITGIFVDFVADVTVRPWTGCFNAISQDIVDGNKSTIGVVRLCLTQVIDERFRRYIIVVPSIPYGSPRRQVIEGPAKTFLDGVECRGASRV